jgi:hypothetical protein
MPLETGSGTTMDDISSNNINGTFAGGGSAPTWSSSCPTSGVGFNGTSNYCVSFDGGDKANTSDNAALDITTNASFVFWFYFNGASDSYDRVFTRDNREWGIISSTGNTDLSWFGDAYNRVAGMTLSNQTWTHCAWTYDTAINRIQQYKNGVAGTPYNSASTDLPTSANGMTFGAESSSYYINGSLDEFGIFNITLDSTDINDIMDNGLYQKASATYYPFKQFTHGINVGVF